jgi:hypothetical protein
MQQGFNENKNVVNFLLIYEKQFSPIYEIWSHFSTDKCEFNFRHFVNAEEKKSALNPLRL